MLCGIRGVPRNYLEVARVFEALAKNVADADLTVAALNLLERERTATVLAVVEPLLYLRSLEYYLQHTLRERIERLEKTASPAQSITLFFHEVIERWLPSS